MELISINPYDIHFGDQRLERSWGKEEVKKKIKDKGWSWVNELTITKEVLLSVLKEGIVDPIIIYSVTRDLYLQGLILKDPYIDPKKKTGFDPIGLYCWRGTQRLRVARLLDYPTIKCLLMEEKQETPPNIEEVQKYFKKEIRIFIEPTLRRWDVMGITENGLEINQILY